ncbi:hypothetical protein CJU90_3714 [Yarrowia sp. C11]|nr:hypothetical protein CKK34_5324 [Yarrowia sp. E02]KAG5367420.1 hypothetical protein CJU90_3714 [Yarrowia sp. C11]
MDEFYPENSVDVNSLVSTDAESAEHNIIAIIELISHAQKYYKFAVGLTDDKPGLQEDFEEHLDLLNTRLRQHEQQLKQYENTRTRSLEWLLTGMLLATVVHWMISGVYYMVVVSFGLGLGFWMWKSR